MGGTREYFEKWILYIRYNIFKFLNDREQRTADDEAEAFRVKREKMMDEYIDGHSKKWIREQEKHPSSYLEWRRRMDKMYREGETFEEKKIRIEANKLSKDLWPNDEK